MQYEIKGTTLQTVEVSMSPGEKMFTESGGMAWYLGEFAMSTNMKGGVMAALGRKLAGESMFLTTYECQSPDGKMTFAAEFPGNIIPLELGDGQSMICQKDAFMCAQESVTLEMHFRKRLGAGLFGGEGFILQRITGPGVAFIEVAGEISEVELAPGQVITVDTGHVAMHEPTVNFDIQTVKGVKNILFGGEGLFLAKLTGPGKVWLQSMPLANLAAKLIPYMPTSSS